MHIHSISGRQRFTIGFGAGLIAGILASALMLLLSALGGGISLPEALGSAIAQAMPPALFESLLHTIGSGAKHYLFYGIVIGQCLVFALSGGLYSLVTGPATRQGKKDDGQLAWHHGLLLALILWIFTGLIFLPLTGAGFFGSLLVIGAASTTVSLAVVGVVFGLIYIFTQNWLATRHLLQQNNTATAQNEDYQEQRRGLIRNSLVVLGIGALGLATWRFITASSGKTPLSITQQNDLLQNYKSKINPPPQPDYSSFQPVTGLSPEITPNDQFYNVSKDVFSDPAVNSSTWSLQVQGEVATPYSLTYKELQAIPTKQQYETMMCISNEVGGSYMSNALWEGVPLVDVLNRAGSIKPGATKVVLYGADSYSDSIHLAKALEPTTLIALRMNGQPLPTGHGYPARLLVPGIYGMKHVKWITKIEVVDTDYLGYWQQSGWDDAAPIRMTSRIDTPVPGYHVKAGQPTYVAGVAFSGNKGISAVDVSFDAGQTWKRANLKRPLSALTWVLWEIPWKPDSGIYNIVVRAIDLEGNVQDPHPADPAPSGSSGYHSATIQAI